MPDSYIFYLLRRFLLFAVFVGLFCLLPGPRRIVASGIAYLMQPDSLASLDAGFQLSITHLRWLMGYELHLLPYPDGVDPLLAGIALLASSFTQVIVGLISIYVLRTGFIYYDAERITEEEEEAETPLVVDLANPIAKENSK